MTSVVVAGALAAKPRNGGEAWVRLSYILGLRRLGIDVSFVEQVEAPSAAGVEWFEAITARFDVRGALVDGAGEPTRRSAIRSAPTSCSTSAATSGPLRSSNGSAGAPTSTSIRASPRSGTPGRDLARRPPRRTSRSARTSDYESLHGPDRRHPTGGRRGRPSSSTSGRSRRRDGFDRFTTVATWRPGHGSRHGRAERVRTARARVSAACRPAAHRVAPLRGGARDRPGRDARPRAPARRRLAARLAATRRVRPRRRFAPTSPTPAPSSPSRRRRTPPRARGWLSDRTARYLASGRPALVEDTGQRTVPTGRGLLTFRTPAEAREGAEAIASDYDATARAARALATRLLRLGRRPRPPAGGRAVTRRRIVVSGMVAADPHQGGAAWAVLQYVLGLRRLGHDVPARRAGRRADAAVASHRSSAPTSAIRALPVGRTRRTAAQGGPPGLAWTGVWARCNADVLINISGMLREPELVEPIPVRVYLDLDPGFNQLWAAADGIDMGFAGHTHFVTVGQLHRHRRLRRPDVRPRLDHDLAPRRPRPLAVLPNAPADDRLHDRRQLARLRLDRYRGRHYGQKAHSLRRLIGIPLQLRRTRSRSRSSIHPDERNDLAALARNGWHLARRRTVAGNAVGLSPLHPGLVRRDRDREERLRRFALRLVQRPQRLLPRLRAAGDRPGHRVRRHAADR